MPPTITSRSGDYRPGQLQACNAVLLRRLRDRGCDRRPDALVEHARDDALLRQVVADNGSDRVGGRELHVLGNGTGPNVERATEDAGEGEHVVDLVREVAAPGGHDAGVLVAHVRVDLRV